MRHETVGKFKGSRILQNSNALSFYFNNTMIEIKQLSNQIFSSQEFNEENFQAQTLEEKGLNKVTHKSIITMSIIHSGLDVLSSDRDLPNNQVMASIFHVKRSLWKAIYVRHWVRKFCNLLLEKVRQRQNVMSTTIGSEGLLPHYNGRGGGRAMYKASPSQTKWAQEV